MITVKLHIDENVYIDQSQRKELFNSIVKPHITPRETTEDMAIEFLHLKEVYGALVTQADYAEVKGVSVVTMINQLKKLQGK